MTGDRYRGEVGIVITRSSWWFSFLGFFLTYYLQCLGVVGYVIIISKEINTCTCGVITNEQVYLHGFAALQVKHCNRAANRAIKRAGRAPSLGGPWLV